jgi:cyanate lyase
MLPNPEGGQRVKITLNGKVRLHAASQSFPSFVPL